MSKYHARRCEIDGIKFDSLREGTRYGELKLAQIAGSISGLRIHVPYDIAFNGVKVCRYVADFVYINMATGREIVEDVKGVRTAVYRLKKKLMRACHGIEILETQ